MGLPTSINAMTKALANVQAFQKKAAQGGALFIKMDKRGDWVYGAEETEIDSDTEWAINPLTFETGFVAFDTNNTRVGEEMKSVTEDPLSISDLNSDFNWQEQCRWQMKCIHGKDEGLEGMVSMCSKGGLKVMAALMTETIENIQKDNPPVPIVTLENDSYKHKTYGKIYTPVFTVIEWIGMDGADAAPAKEVVKKEVEKKPAKRRTRRAK